MQKESTRKDQENGVTDTDTVDRKCPQILRKWSMKEVETKQTALKNKPIYLILRTLGKDTGVAKASGWGSSRAEHRESGGAGNMKQGEWSCWEYEAWRLKDKGL